MSGLRENQPGLSDAEVALCEILDIVTGFEDSVTKIEQIDRVARMYFLDELSRMRGDLDEPLA